MASTTIQFKQAEWSCTRKELEKALVDHVREYGKFDSGEFFSVRDYLPRGNVKDYHTNYVNQLSTKMHLAGTSLTNVSSSTDILATRIVEHILGRVHLFHNNTTPYARLQIDSHYENWPIKSQSFKRFISREFYDLEGRPPNESALSSALTVIEAKAIFECPHFELYNRVAWHDNAIWFDLSNRDWQAVKVTSNGWEIVDDPPILFKRYAHQRPAVMPKQTSERTLRERINRIFELVNHEVEYRVLLLSELVCILVPDVPHPVIVVYGEQGSTKSTFFKILKALFDPSALETLSMPRKEIEMVQQVSHHWFVPYDNVSKLWDWQSDLCCRAATGEGHTKRQLFTDDEDIIYKYKRVLGINGINMVAQRPDLLDRTILHKLPAVDIKDRITEAEIEERFNDIAPDLMAAIFDVLSKAISLYPQIQLTAKFRMADFTIWGAAIAEAIGFNQQEFLDQYHDNRISQNKEAVWNNPVGVVLMKWREKWIESHKDKELISCIESPQTLYAELTGLAEEMKFDTERKGSGWPRTASAMGKKIGRLATNLRAVGLCFESRHIGKEGRIWELEVVNTDTAVTGVIPLQRTLDDYKMEQKDNGTDNGAVTPAVTTKPPKGSHTGHSQQGDNGRTAVTVKSVPSKLDGEIDGSPDSARAEIAGEKES